MAGGPAGATGSSASLKRKRAEPQFESDDEEDSDDNEKANSQTPKAKKKSATELNIKTGPPRNGSSSSKAPPASSSSRVKAEPVPSPVVPFPQAPKPATIDRMAALRRAKEAIMQQQQPSAQLVQCVLQLHVTCYSCEPVFPLDIHESTSQFFLLRDAHSSFIFSKWRARRTNRCYLVQCWEVRMSWL